MTNVSNEGSIHEQTGNMATAMMPLYAARIEDLGAPAISSEWSAPRAGMTS
jgi:hypothetical protein